MKPDESKQAIYSIGTVARMLNISVQTLRMYEQRGLLVTEKSSGRQRMYSLADIRRIECLRNAINNEKISIEGIRRIHALIPCWEHIRCPLEQRERCPAYTSDSGGCWSFKHTKDVCAGKDCRGCEVYALATDCGAIKSLIRKAPRHHTHKQSIHERT